MRYFAPIVNFIAKSTFVESDTFNFIRLITKPAYQGWQLASGVEDAIITHGVIRTAIWSITDCYLWIVPFSSVASMKIHMQVTGSVEGSTFDDFSVSSIDFTIGATVANQRLKVDIGTMFASIPASTNFGLLVDYTATANDTNASISCLEIVYTLI